jgi:hypothetical protein
MTENYVIIVFEDKVSRNFDYLIKSVFILNLYIFWEKMIKIEKNFAKYLTNGFLVLSKQSRTKLKDCDENQNQMKTR